MLIKTCRKAALYRTESHRLMGVYHWLIRKDKTNNHMRAVDRAAVLRFQQETAELLRRAQGASERAGEAARRLEAARKALMQTPGADPKLMSRTRELERRLADLRERLTGDRTLGRFDEARPLPILQRIGEVAGGSWNTTQAPTETQRQSLTPWRASSLRRRARRSAR